MADTMELREMQRLRAEFGRDFASSAFRYVDREAWIVGRYGRITVFPCGAYDAWFFGWPKGEPVHADRIAPMPMALGMRRLHNFRRAALPHDKLRILNGEAYAQSYDPDFVRRMARLMRVRRKVRLSPERARALRTQLANARFAQSSLRNSAAGDGSGSE